MDVFQVCLYNFEQVFRSTMIYKLIHLPTFVFHNYKWHSNT